MQRLFLDSFLVLSVSVQSTTMQCDFSWGDTSKYDTNNRPKEQFHPTLPWGINGVIEVLYRDTGAGLWTATSL